MKLLICQNVLICFPLLQQNTWNNELKKGEIILAFSFSHQSVGPVAFGPVVRQCAMQGSMVEEAAHLVFPRMHKTMRNNERGWGPKTPFKGTPQWPNIHLVGATSWRIYYLPMGSKDKIFNIRAFGTDFHKPCIRYVLCTIIHNGKMPISWIANHLLLGFPFLLGFCPEFSTHVDLTSHFFPVNLISCTCRINS
jgi:hypothetical protein